MTSEPPFRPLGAQATNLFCLALLVAFTYFAYSTGTYRHLHFVIPCILIAWAIGRKLSAPLIPWKHIVFAAVFAIALSTAFDMMNWRWPILYFLTEAAFTLILRRVLVRRWIENGWAPTDFGR